MDLLRRRQHPSKWSAKRWKQLIRVCFTSDPDREDVKASVIVHWDLNLLPKDTVRLAQQEAAEEGEEWAGFRDHACFLFGFDDEDRVTIFMGGELAVCVRGMLQSRSLEEAAADAREWVGAGALELPFENIPGLYQAAFFEYVTGEESDIGPAMFMWALPPVGDVVPIRQFPPDVSG